MIQEHALKSKPGAPGAWSALVGAHCIDGTSLKDVDASEGASRQDIEALREVLLIYVARVRLQHRKGSRYMDPGRGSARDGKKIGAEGSVDFEVFQSIFPKVVRELNGSFLAGEQVGGRFDKVVTVSMPEGPVRVNLPNMHRRLKHEASLITKERCAESLRSMLTECALEQMPSRSFVRQDLKLTVRT